MDGRGRPADLLLRELTDVRPPAGSGTGASTAGRSWPWWLQVGGVWLLSRLFTLAWTLFALGRQGLLAHEADVPGDYFGYAGMWDGTFYQRISQGGYPLVAGLDAGVPQPAGEYAFLPVYPFVVRMVTDATGLPWPVVATSVSVLACLGFLLVAYRLFRPHGDAPAALAATAAVAFATAAPVLQYAYAESLGLLLLASALLFMDRGQYLLAAPTMVVAGLTRPIGVPLFVSAVIVAGLALVGARRAGGTLPRARLVGFGVLVAGGFLAATAWPVAAGLLTGVPDAYLRAEGYWHGGAHAPLLEFLASLLGPLGVPLGSAAAVLVVAGFVTLMLSRPVLRLGPVLWSWVGCLLGYLILLTPVSSSTPRLLLPAFPLALAAMNTVGRSWRWLVIGLGALTQVVWILVLWHLADGVTDSSP